MASDLFAKLAFGSGNFIQSCPGGRAAAGADAGLAAACHDASGGGLRIAMICGAMFFLWAALHFLLAARTLRRDVYAAPSS
jgi:hypothetical protein